MCGRYSLTRRETEIVERFGVEHLLADDDESLKPRFNIAPSQMVPVILDDEGKRRLAVFKWGLIPFWTKDLSKTKPVINARSETIAEKPTFKHAFSKRRCLIPADGFFEWKKQNKDKVPMFIHIPEQELFAFAGLWDEWRSPEGEVLRTCTIITTAANETMAPVHDRMPIIVRPEHESLWLDVSVKGVKELEPVLEPWPNEGFEMYPVSSAVNSPSIDRPELLERAALQASLLDQLN